jgi:methyl-accepting chemotaxis protein
MFNWITNRISMKIVVALTIVLAVIMGGFTSLLVKRRGEVLRQQLLTKARAMALVGARSMEQVLEDAIASGQFFKEQIFDTDYREITQGPLAGSAIPKYHTAYDTYLDETIQKIQDTLVEEDSMVVFAVLVDRNGYLPTHNTIYSRPLTGNSDIDKVGNRTKRIFNDPVGLAAAKYDGGDGNKILRQEYKRDTGETMWDISAPLYVRGDHWGAFRIGFSIQETDQAITELRNTVGLSMLLVLLVASVTIYFVVARLIRPLLILTLVAERISDGQLDETIEIDSNDEIGRLASAFNKMTQVIVKNLKGEIDKSKRMVGSVKEAIQQLSSSANEIMAISSQQSSGATQQASAVQQATTTSEEIAVTAKQVAENALRVEAQAEQASAACNNGIETVDNAVEGMGHLKGQVQSIAEAMLELGENSQKIGGIVDIIDEISDQTNLLALNAAIEAAGAGEAGKRFSIVAGEVKRLAERTVDATGQIKGLIDQIQKATNSTIMLTEEGTKGVDSASTLVARISEALANIIDMVQETNNAAMEIKLSTQQQTTASEQMAQTVAEVRDVATQVAASAQETSHAIAELTALAENLKDLLEEELQTKGTAEALSGAREMAEILGKAVAGGKFTLQEIFDENYVPIPGTDPRKYHTKYDRFLDETIVGIQDAFLKQDNQVVFAVLADRNGYVPTHNSRYTQPLTGNREKDTIHNRTKRIFNDNVGLAAARNRQEILVQVYERDTGDKIWDISAPVYVRGKHWGAFRIGYQM